MATAQGTEYRDRTGGRETDRGGQGEDTPDSPGGARRGEDDVERSEKKDEDVASFPEMNQWIDRATA